MIERTQTVTCTPGNGWAGNCWQTCVAMLLNVDPEEMPAQEFFDLYWTKADGTKDASRTSPSYRDLLAIYLRKHHGLAYVEMHVPEEATAMLRMSEPGWHMMTGRTVRSDAFGGARHVVVARHGREVWDPHPSHAGLLEEKRWAMLVPFPKDFERWWKGAPCMCRACGTERYMGSTILCRFVERIDEKGPCGSQGCTEPECRTRSVYVAPDGAKAEDARPGDLYFVRYHEPGADWCWQDCDGMHLFCRLPDGTDWNIDGRASNCTMREDRAHRCWVRHGDPRAGSLHVDKAGRTCQAGAGSIQSGAYHGFLHLGSLRAC